MLRYATPLIFAALGGLVSERSGVVNIGLEGMMLDGRVLRRWGADVAARGCSACSCGWSPAALLALVHAFFSIQLRADQIVSGIAMNFLALGLHRLPLHRRSTATRARPTTSPQVPDVYLPRLQDRVLRRRARQLNLLIWVALLVIVALAVFLFRTRAGAAPAVGRREPAGGRDGRHPVVRGRAMSR